MDELTNMQINLRILELYLKFDIRKLKWKHSNEDIAKIISKDFKREISVAEVEHRIQDKNYAEKRKEIVRNANRS